MISYNNITIGSFVIIIIVMALHWYDSGKVENKAINQYEILTKKFGKETRYDAETTSYIWQNIDPFDQIIYSKNEDMIYLFVPSVNVDIIDTDNVKYDQGTNLLLIIDKTWNNVLARLYLSLNKINDTTVFNDTVESLDEKQFEDKIIADINSKLIQLNGQKQNVPPRQEPPISSNVGINPNLNPRPTVNPNAEKFTQLDTNWQGEMGVEQVSLDNLYTFN